MRISDWSSDVCSSDLVEAMVMNLSWASAPVANPAASPVASIDAAKMPNRRRVGVNVMGCGPPFDRRRSPEQVAAEEGGRLPALRRSEEHTSELQSLMRISYAVFCLKKKKKTTHKSSNIKHTI